jgi:cyclase
MLKTRIIPSLLLKNNGLVKTVCFKRQVYVGDPINAVRIFNDKEVDELAVIDIEATHRGSINYELLSRINKEAFMPLAYGGGIKNAGEIERILSLGYEKVIVNTGALVSPHFIAEAASIAGSQSVVVCIDMKKNWLGRCCVYNHLTHKTMSLSAMEWAKRMETEGAGEILLYDVDREGTGTGYNIPAIREVAHAVTIPVIALGGAGRLEDFAEAVLQGGASAVAAGSFFVFHGPHRAVLITYPDKEALKGIFGKR